MKKNSSRSSVDGFIPRRPGSQLGDLHLNEEEVPIDRSLHTGDNAGRQVLGEARKGKVIGQDDLTASLSELDSIDGEEPDKKIKKGRRRRKDRVKRRLSKPKKIILAIVIVLLLAGLGIGGYVVWKAISAGNSVFQGNIFDIVQNEPLKEDANGRSNFLIFGTAEDDWAGDHDGPNLTDSIMVISIDQDKKDAYMISLPRDLWIAYDPPCVPGAGYQGKINAAYLCASNNGQNEKKGAEILSRKVGEIVGLDIQYYVHLNFTVVVDAVNAVGGVDVKIESDDPRGIYDIATGINYKNGQVVHLNGERALAFSRARNSHGGYGLGRGNFDREQNQQKVIKALREKAVSAGTLANLGAVTGLLDALGKNLRTNIATKEIRTLMALGSEIQSDDIIQLSLVDDDEPLVITGMQNGQSIVRPILGLLDYSAIAAYVDKNVNSTPISREDPQIMVMNGGAAAGVAGKEADKLAEFGYTVLSVSNVPSGTYKGVTIYQLDADKSASAAKLQEIYGVTPDTARPPFSVVGEADFVVIIGTGE